MLPAAVLILKPDDFPLRPAQLLFKEPHMSHLVDIFLQPGKVFADLKEKPTFILPMALVTIGTAVMMFLYYQKVDSAWLIEHMLSANPEMTAKDAAQAKQMTPGAKMMSYITAGSTLVFVPVVMLIYALYYMLAGKVAGHSISFKHGVSLVSWSGMPTLISIIVVLIGVFMMEPQTSLESLQLLNLDPLLVELPVDSHWSSLAKSFSLLTPWMIFLSALGWRLWGKTGWGEALAVVLLPSIVIYGVWVTYILLK